MRHPATLILTALLSPGLAAPAPTAADEAPDEARSVSVTGHGEVFALPDRARIELGVEARETELASARERVNAAVRAFLDFARSLDIDERHLDSTALSVQPEYEWDGDARRRVFVGYRVSRSLRIELTALERLGELMAGAVEHGINRVSPPQLEASGHRRHVREALARAAADARANAETLAGTLGMRLGEVRTIETREREAGPVHERDAVMIRARSETGDAAESYAAGELRFSARVRARFDLVAADAAE